MRGHSKREHCPKCGGTKMENFVHVEAGQDMAVFVECSSCNAFVSRYTLKNYTSDDFYHSYLRFIHQRRMSSGGQTKKALEQFRKKILDGYQKVKEEVADNEATKKLDEIIE